MKLSKYRVGKLKIGLFRLKAMILHRPFIYQFVRSPKFETYLSIKYK